MVQWVTIACRDNFLQLYLSIYCGVICSGEAVVVPEPRRLLYVGVIRGEALIAGLVDGRSLVQASVPLLLTPRERGRPKAGLPT